MSTQTVSTVETREQALHRLAAQARDTGVRVLVYPATNEHFAESASHPGELHRVTMVSCDCRGWMRHGRCMHNAAVLAMYHNLPRLDPEPGPDRAGAASAAPADVIVSIAPARSRVEQVNGTAAAGSLDSGRDDQDRWDLTSALLGEDYFRVCGMTERAVEAWCRATAGQPSLARVCPSPMCGGRGHIQTHPTDDGEWCRVCAGSGVVPGHSVAIAVMGEEVRHAA